MIYAKRNSQTYSPAVIYAQVIHHNALLAAIRRRRDELGITNETLEEIAGLQGGYASKILADPPAKRMGPFTLFLIADALGLSLAFMENPELAAKMAVRYTKRRISKPVLASASMVQITRDQMQIRARRGGFERAAKLSEKRRSAIARRAALARWGRRGSGTLPAAIQGSGSAQECQPQAVQAAAPIGRAPGA